jgi:hypothetical protein
MFKLAWPNVNVSAVEKTRIMADFINFNHECIRSFQIYSDWREFILNPMAAQSSLYPYAKRYGISHEILSLLHFSCCKCHFIVIYFYYKFACLKLFSISSNYYSVYIHRSFFSILKFKLNNLLYFAALLCTVAMIKFFDCKY